MVEANLSFSIGTFSNWYSCREIETDRMLVPEVPGIYAVMDRETGVLYSWERRWGTSRNDREDCGTGSSRSI